MGLPLRHSIPKMRGGKLEGKAKEGEGKTFKIIFPTDATGLNY